MRLCTGLHSLKVCKAQHLQQQQQQQCYTFALTASRRAYCFIAAPRSTSAVLQHSKHVSQHALLVSPASASRRDSSAAAGADSSRARGRPRLDGKGEKVKPKHSKTAGRDLAGAGTAAELKHSKPSRAAKHSSNSTTGLHTKKPATGPRTETPATSHPAAATAASTQQQPSATTSRGSGDSRSKSRSRSRSRSASREGSGDSRSRSRGNSQSASRESSGDSRSRSRGRLQGAGRSSKQHSSRTSPAAGSAAEAGSRPSARVPAGVAAVSADVKLEKRTATAAADDGSTGTSRGSGKGVSKRDSSRSSSSRGRSSSRDGRQRSSQRASTGKASLAEALNHHEEQKPLEAKQTQQSAKQRRKLTASTAAASTAAAAPADGSQSRVASDGSKGLAKRWAKRWPGLVPPPKGATLPELRAARLQRQVDAARLAPRPQVSRRRRRVPLTSCSAKQGSSELLVALQEVPAARVKLTQLRRRRQPQWHEQWRKRSPKGLSVAMIRARVEAGQQQIDTEEDQRAAPEKEVVAEEGEAGAHDTRPAAAADLQQQPQQEEDTEEGEGEKARADDTSPAAAAAAAADLQRQQQQEEEEEEEEEGFCYRPWPPPPLLPPSQPVQQQQQQQQQQARADGVESSAGQLEQDTAAEGQQPAADQAADAGRAQLQSEPCTPSSSQDSEQEQYGISGKLLVEIGLSVVFSGLLLYPCELAADPSCATAAVQDSSADPKPKPQTQEDPEPARPHKPTGAVAPYSAIARAGSMGMILKLLQDTLVPLSGATISMAYARAAVLCDRYPPLLQHSATQQVLLCLRHELPIALQHNMQPWHLALAAAANLQLQQPQLFRHLWLRLLSSLAFSRYALPGCVLACMQQGQVQLVRVLLLLLLQDEQLPPGAGSWLVKASPNPMPPVHSALTLEPAQRQQLHELLLELLQGAPPQQRAVAVWAAARWRHTAEMKQLLISSLPHILSGPPQAIARMLHHAVVACEEGDLEAWQVWQLVNSFEQQLGAASARDISTVLHAVAMCKLRMTGRQLHALLAALQEQLQAATVQDVQRVMWALSAMKAGVANASVQQLLARFVQLLPQATHGQISTVMWSVRAIKGNIRAEHMRTMVDAFLESMPTEAAAVHMARLLCSAAVLCNASRQLPLSAAQLQRFEDVAVAEWLKEDLDNPTSVYNMLWALSQLHFYPARLLDAMQEAEHAVERRLQAASSAHLCACVVAFAQLGAQTELLTPIVRVLEREESATGVIACRAAANICWSLCLLRRLDCAHYLEWMATRCGKLWRDATVKEQQQLYQVHLWLCNEPCAYLPEGLLGPLTQEQLDECKAAWHSGDLSDTTTTSMMQQQVFEAMQSLPTDAWQQPPQLEQLTDDGALSIDIAAVTASGVQLAVEVDGPQHFLLPDNRPDGPTQFRNAVLAARGYTVVSISYWEWQELGTSEQQGTYLQSKLLH